MHTSLHGKLAAAFHGKGSGFRETWKNRDEAGIPTRSNWHTKPASPPGSSKQPFSVPFRTENSRRQKLPLGIPAGAGAAGVLDSGETYAALWECEFRG